MGLLVMRNAKEEETMKDDIPNAGTTVDGAEMIPAGVVELTDEALDADQATGGIPNPKSWNWDCF